MPRPLKSIIRIFIIATAVVLVAAAVLWQFRPKAGEALLTLPGGASGVLQGYVYIWVVPTSSGVVLIDAGGDAKAPELLAELKRRGKGPDDVKAILLTHGHFDHWPGSAAFPKATVYVHPAEISTMRGEKKPTHFLVRLMVAFRKAQPLPRAMASLVGGENLKIDGESFQVVRIPGHTEGSLMYLWKGVLFTGDSVQDDKKGGLTMPPAMFSDELALLERELKKTLPTLKFQTLATSHTGIIADGTSALASFLAGKSAGK